MRQRWASWASLNPSCLARRHDRASIASAPPASSSVVALLDDAGDLVEEPLVDAAGGVDLLDGDAAPDQLGDLEDALRRRRADGGQQPGRRLAGELALGGVGVESEAALLERAQRLLQALRERPPDRHHLADRLHLRCRARPVVPGSFSNAHRGTFVTT